MCKPPWCPFAKVRRRDARRAQSVATRREDARQHSRHRQRQRRTAALHRTTESIVCVVPSQPELTPTPSAKTTGIIIRSADAWRAMRRPHIFFSKRCYRRPPACNRLRCEWPAALSSPLETTYLESWPTGVSTPMGYRSATLQRDGASALTFDFTGRQAVFRRRASRQAGGMYRVGSSGLAWCLDISVSVSSQLAAVAGEIRLRGGGCGTPLPNQPECAPTGATPRIPCGE